MGQERLTKRVGVGCACWKEDTDLCIGMQKIGECKTGYNLKSNEKPFSWENHCDDKCILGKIVNKLALLEDWLQSDEEANLKFYQFCEENKND